MIRIVLIAAVLMDDVGVENNICAVKADKLDENGLISINGLTVEQPQNIACQQIRTVAIRGIISKYHVGCQNIRLEEQISVSDAQERNIAFSPIYRSDFACRFTAAVQRFSLDEKGKNLITELPLIPLLLLTEQ